MNCSSSVRGNIMVLSTFKATDIATFFQQVPRKEAVLCRKADLFGTQLV
jgi:hypothetical protein